MVVAIVVAGLVDTEVALVVTTVAGVTVDSVVTGQLNCSPTLKLVHSVQ